MFQVAMLSVSSSFEDGILAFAILDCRTLRPLAISGEIFPWFMMVPFQMSCHSEGAARRICFSIMQKQILRFAQDDSRPFASRIARHRRSGVAGMSKRVTPARRSASD